jgi:hypothetical protein
MPDTRNKNLRYRRIPLGKIWEILKFFEGEFNNFLRLKCFPEDIKYHVSGYTLIDIIVRVDKRKAYYHCFHNMDIDECKEVALYAYWILKLRPFTIIDDAYKENYDACNINEAFVIYLIGSILEQTKRIKQTKKIKDSYTKFLEYSFRFRNFTIDSFIVLIESISTETLEKEYPNLYDQPNQE